MHSDAKSTAVSKPNVDVVFSRSLSIVLGTPTTRSPASVQLARHRQRPVAADRDQRVDSVLLEAAEQLLGSVDLDPGAVGLLHRDRRSGCPGWWCRGSCRPDGRCRELCHESARSAHRRGIRSGNSNPLKPSRIPTTSQSRFRAARVAARITAFSPGASPPPVLRAMRLMEYFTKRTALSE